ncbi:hypothetical protein [Sinobacterium norvegicum]|uniref:hypothetical protein n=1 Tax=Sinobacterium norvegicum TaxID=1641715 RepID=UPI001F363A8B|nr:hypothetical protein [Sinobacterium norvegicum]
MLIDSDKYQTFKQAMSTWDRKELLVGVVIASEVVSVGNLKDLIDLTALVEVYQCSVQQPRK